VRRIACQIVELSETLVVLCALTAICGGEDETGSFETNGATGELPRAEHLWHSPFGTSNESSAPHWLHKDKVGIGVSHEVAEIRHPLRKDLNTGLRDSDGLQFVGPGQNCFEKNGFHTPASTVI
jgi:hypothetical protein